MREYFQLFEGFSVAGWIILVAMYYYNRYIVLQDLQYWQELLQYHIIMIDDIIKDLKEHAVRSKIKMLPETNTHCEITNFPPDISFSWEADDIYSAGFICRLPVAERR